LSPHRLRCRSFHIAEGLRLVFRADLFNALNHPNFGLFGISMATTANSNVGGPGAAQLSLKLEF
jgi:hypothetical protein